MRYFTFKGGPFETYEVTPPSPLGDASPPPSPPPPPLLLFTAPEVFEMIGLPFPLPFRTWEGLPPTDRPPLVVSGLLGRFTGSDPRMGTEPGAIAGDVMMSIDPNDTNLAIQLLSALEL